MSVRIAIPTIPCVAASIFFVYYIFLSPLFLFHNDLGWHIAAGNLIAQTGTIPNRDVWSFTTGDHPWYLFSWLWDYLAAKLHNLYGFTVLLVATAVAGASILYIQTLQAVKLGSTPLAICIVIGLSGLSLPQFSPPDVFLAVTPQVITLVLIPVFQFVLMSLRERVALVSASLLPILMILWVNMHGGFVIGIGIIGVFLAQAIWDKSKQRIKTYSAVLVACLLAGCINPWGIESYSKVLEFLFSDTQNGISEWQSVFARFEGKTDIPSVVFLCVSVLGFYGARHTFKTHWLLWLFTLLLYVKAWQQIRYISLFTVWSMPWIAYGISNLLAKSEQAAMPPLGGKASLMLMIVISIASALVWNYRYEKSPDLPDVRWPKEEITFIERNYAGKNLLNHWNYGSFIIYQTRGTLRVFIDGRANTAYPLSTFENFEKLSSTSGWTEVIKKYNIGVVLWPKIDTKMQAYFKGNSDWQLVYEGRMAMVFARKE